MLEQKEQGVMLVRIEGFAYLAGEIPISRQERTISRSGEQAIYDVEV